MPHVIEPAPSGRASCRGCGGKIPMGALRFGERLPNPYADEGGEMTHWFHLTCAAYRRPEPFLETLANTAGAIADVDQLTQQALLGVTHRRLPRVSTAGRASSGRATCRACKEAIAKSPWRSSRATAGASRWCFTTMDGSCRRDSFTPGARGRTSKRRTSWTASSTSRLS